VSFCAAVFPVGVLPVSVRVWGLARSASQRRAPLSHFFHANRLKSIGFRLPSNIPFPSSFDYAIVNTIVLASMRITTAV
jgi:hypothetical protein